MFETTLELFRDYYRLMDQADVDSFDRNLGVEVDERLQQLDFLLRKVEQNDTVLRGFHRKSQDQMVERQRLLEQDGLDWTSGAHPMRPMSSDQLDAQKRAMFEARLYTESFYFFAHRIRTILQLRSKPLPGLSGFEATGLRDVRNHLVEHAGGKQESITTPSFGFGGTNGPVVKAVRQADQIALHVDEGLYANARKMRAALESRLQLMLKDHRR